jgi:uroporphyrinogen-III synthase
MATCPPPQPEGRLPLVLVTRPAAQARAWVEALQAEGIGAAALPLIHIAPTADGRPVHAAWLSLPAQAFVMFVSANAVEQFFALRPAGAAWPGAARRCHRAGNGPCAARCGRRRRVDRHAAAAGGGGNALG